MEPMTFTAATIATLAFTKFIESGAGELAKKFTEGAIAKMETLRQKIWNKMRGKASAEMALTAIKQGKQEEFDRLVAYLQVAMDDDPQFATELKQLAEQIIQEVNIDQVEGRNIMNIFGGQGQQFNNENINAPVQQGTINNHHYYGTSKD